MGILKQLIIALALASKLFQSEKLMGMSPEEKEENNDSGHIFNQLTSTQQLTMIQAYLHASATGNLKAVTKALHEGVPVDETASYYEHYTALSIAVRKGHTEIILLLLTNGANPNALSAKIDSFTPLQWTAIHGNSIIAKALLTHTANVHTPLMHHDYKGQYSTALSLAAHNNHVEIVKLLIFAGADPCDIERLDHIAPRSKRRLGYIKTLHTIVRTIQEEMRMATADLNAIENALVDPLATPIPITGLIHIIRDYATPYYPDNQLLNEFVQQKIKNRHKDAKAKVMPNKTAISEIPPIAAAAHAMSDDDQLEQNTKKRKHTQTQDALNEASVRHVKRKLS